MCDLEKNVEKAEPNKGRKRKKQPELWEKNKQREKRYTPTDLPTPPTCRHNTKTLKCAKLTMADLSKIHAVFYHKKNKIYQDNFILQHSIQKNVNRHRPKNSLRVPKKMSVEYMLPKPTSGGQVRVCKAAFLSILGIKKDRVSGVLERSFKSSGAPAKENRGGDRRSQANAEKSLAVCSFIESLKGSEPHYCRGKSSGRIYLSSELNIKTIWRIYNENAEHTKKVKQSYFRNIFNTTYNIGFGSPRTDVCSRCTELKERIKTSTNPMQKQELITQKRIHTLRAKTFYNMLKTAEDNVITMSFDCQKNMMLPKLPDQSAYFSRQINFYNFTVVFGTSKSPLLKEKVLMYYWDESESCKGSNEIASAVFHALNSIDIPHNINTVRMFADGCGGQNKNSTMIGMCSKWLFTHAPRQVKKVEIIFPVVGHSFLPADRVFAKIEKELRKIEVITNPNQYLDVLKRHGTPYHLSQEVPIYYFKTQSTNVLKAPGAWHFKFNLSKRFFITRGQTNVFVKGEEHYRTELNEHKVITKKSKTITNIDPIPVPYGNILKKEKVVDVIKLLAKHYGVAWKQLEDLKFYVDIHERNSVNVEVCEHDLECEPVEENENFI